MGTGTEDTPRPHPRCPNPWGPGLFQPNAWEVGQLGQAHPGAQSKVLQRSRDFRRLAGGPAVSQEDAAPGASWRPLPRVLPPSGEARPN